jgi:hypothetical protein
MQHAPICSIHLIRLDPTASARGFSIRLLLLPLSCISPRSSFPKLVPPHFPLIPPRSLSHRCLRRWELAAGAEVLAKCAAHLAPDSALQQQVLARQTQLQRYKIVMEADPSFDTWQQVGASRCCCALTRTPDRARIIVFTN